MLKSYLFCGYFLICNFSFPDRASINAYWNRIILNPLFRVEKNKSATNPITCGRRIRIFLESDDVAKSCLVCYWTVTQYGGTKCRPSFSRVNLDTLGCVWTDKFDFNTLRVDGENFESGKKKTRIQKYSDPSRRGPSQRDIGSAGSSSAKRELQDLVLALTVS